MVLVGFGIHRGSVIASERWAGQVRRMTVPPARAGSLEAVLHQATGGEDGAFVLPRDRDGWSQAVLDHRAIVVVYRPESERRCNYVPTVLGRRYDAFLYCDHTTALRPLHPLEHPDTEPETYPSGQ